MVALVKPVRRHTAIWRGKALEHSEAVEAALRLAGRDGLSARAAANLCGIDHNQAIWLMRRMCQRGVARRIRRSRGTWYVWRG